jgi:hypothetical protein
MHKFILPTIVLVFLLGFATPLLAVPSACKDAEAAVKSAQADMAKAVSVDEKKQAAAEVKAAQKTLADCIKKHATPTATPKPKPTVTPVAAAPCKDEEAAVKSAQADMGKAVSVDEKKQAAAEVKAAQKALADCKKKHPK